MKDNKRKIQLKTSVIHTTTQQKELVHINFSSMGKQPPSVDEYSVESEHNKQKLGQFLNYMHRIDEPFFKWLEADASNSILFANNPVEALKKAIPNFDETILNDIPKNILV